MSKNNTYALLISVGNYDDPKIMDLTSSRVDLFLMEDSLIEGLKISQDNIRLIGENGSATIHNLAHAMKDFSRMLKEEDTFLFYFSGHGSNGELIFSDQAIGLQSVINYIEKLPTKNKILILDCCYAGSFSEMAPRTINLQDSIQSFVGNGTAVLASSSADEMSRLGPGGDHSLFTGMVSNAFVSKQIIRKGKKSLASIIEYVRDLMDTWNRQHPEKSQQPIIRSSIGGTIYFDIEEYQPYQPKTMAYETQNYKLCSVKPLNNSQEKRLVAFVIPQKEDFEDEIPKITNHIANVLKVANIFATKKTELFFRNKSAKVIWCYFGKDESDIINSTHYAYSIWASNQKTADKYFRPHADAYIKDGIYIFKNSSYDMLRSMRDESINIKEYEEDVRKLFYRIIEHAEQYINCMTEVYNRRRSMEEAKKQYIPWVKEVYQLYYRLTDIAIAPDQIHDWVEEVLQLAGWVIDMTLILQNNSKTASFDDRNRWLFQNAVKNYYDSLEGLNV
ncbi:MAG: caspase family protein [Eubacteriales bacterium]|nr:caspase family protein [Eubacteriales bacterium]